MNAIPEPAEPLAGEPAVADARAEIVHGLERLALVLPPMPAVVLRLQQELANEWVNIQRLATLVRTDPTLSGSVLRVANSPFWRGTRQISEVEEAIQRIGLEMLRSLVTVLAVRSSKIVEKGPLGSDMADFWRHSLLVAVGSVQIARRSPMDRATLEQVWMAGLLHDIGALLAPLLYPAAWAEMAKEFQGERLKPPVVSEPDSSADPEPDPPPQRDLMDLEEKRLGTHHARIGGVFAERHWHLPATISLGIETWPTPDVLEPPLMAWTLRRADEAAQVLGVCWQPPSTRIRGMLDLPPETGAGPASDASVCMECLEKSIPLVDALLSTD